MVRSRHNITMVFRIVLAIIPGIFFKAFTFEITSQDHFHIERRNFQDKACRIIGPAGAGGRVRESNLCHSIGATVEDIARMDGSGGDISRMEFIFKDNGIRLAALKEIGC